MYKILLKISILLRDDEVLKASVHFEISFLLFSLIYITGEVRRGEKEGRLSYYGVANTCRMLMLMRV